MLSLFLSLALVVQPTPALAESAQQLFGRSLGGLFGGRALGVNSAFVDRLQQTGTATLRLLGNRLVVLDRISGNITPLVFAGGVPFGIPNTQFEQTLRDLSQFILSRLDNAQGIPGINRNDAANFLVRAGFGQAISGQLSVNLAGSVLPGQFASLTGQAANDVKRRALNLVLNVISQSGQIMSVGRNDVLSGIANLNLRGRIGGGALAAAFNPLENPYACSRTGRDPVRLDWMIARAMDPQFYYQLIGAPANEEQLSRQLGYQFNRARTGRNKFVAKGSESLVATDKDGYRVLEVQNLAGPGLIGGSIYRTFDNRYNNAVGAAKDGGNPMLNGINASYAAGELLGHKPNGFPFAYLAAYENDARGLRQNSAPVEIAQNQGYCKGGQTGRTGTGNDVSAPLTCFCCHTAEDGTFFLGGGKSRVTGQPYTETFGQLPSFHQQFFTTGPMYAQRAKRDSQVIVNSMLTADAMQPGAGMALLPMMVNEYRKDVSIRALAKEIDPTGRVRPEQIASLIGMNVNGSIPRARIEEKLNVGGQQISQFCRLAAAVGSGVSGGFQQQAPGLGGAGARPQVGGATPGSGGGATISAPHLTAIRNDVGGGGGEPVSETRRVAD